MNRAVFGSAAAALALASGVALAHVKHDGTWPEKEKTVSLDVDHASRSDAVKKLADAAGWSIVVQNIPGPPVDVHVKDQSPAKVLDLILSEGDYVASRDGTLIALKGAPPGADASDKDHASAQVGTPAAPEVPPVPPVPAIAPMPPMPPMPAVPSAATHGDGDDDQDEADVAPKRAGKAKHAEDRTVMGGNLTIGKGEVAHDVSVFGGNVDVLGEATGDIQVLGGDVRLRSGAHVHGDATVLGGTLSIDDGAAVDGDVNVLGGTLHRGPHCTIGGSVTSKGDNDDEAGSMPSGKHRWHSKVNDTLADIGGALTRSAMLFLFGAVLLALAGTRMESLRIEVAARPMRSLALGVVGVLGSLLVIAALCVTIVGIPVALVGLLVGVFGVYAGVCAALTVVGEALLRHRTKNPYVHLAIGCAIFLVVGFIPFVGGLATLALALIGVGVLVATRGAGDIKPRKRPGEGPYRSAVETEIATLTFGPRARQAPSPPCIAPHGCCARGLLFFRREIHATPRRNLAALMVQPMKLGIAGIAVATLTASPPLLAASEQAAAPEPAPAPPYSLPFQLRPAAAGNVLRVDSAFARYEDAASNAGLTVASTITASYKIAGTGQGPTGLAPVLRFAIANDSPPVGNGALVLSNPLAGASYTAVLGGGFRASGFFGITLPIGTGGGDAPDVAIAPARAKAQAARSAMDNALFAVNDLTLVPGVDLAWVGGGFTLQIEATLFQLERVRGSAKQLEATKTNLTSGVHAGYFVAPFLSIGAELRYQRWLNAPFSVDKDPTGASVDNMTLAVGPRAHLPLGGDMWLRPGIAYARGIDKPLAAATPNYHIVFVDLPFVF